MDKLTQAAADWVARDEPGERFYVGLYAARRKHGASEDQATRELADYMRFRLSQAADSGLQMEDLDRIHWTQIARQHAIDGEFLYLYRQFDGRKRYGVRQYMKELQEEARPCRKK